jgi:anti-anti-sigma factor
VPDQDPFEIIEEDVGQSVRVIALRGDADRFRADTVTHAVQRAWSHGRTVVIDMSDTAFMDSSMLAALVAASDQARRRAETLVLVVRAPRLKRSLEVKGLSGILTVADSREQALELVESGGDESMSAPA